MTRIGICFLIVGLLASCGPGVDQSEPIGHAEVVSVEPESGLTQVLGESTYRIRTEVESYATGQPEVDPFALVYISEVIESDDPNRFAVSRSTETGPDDFEDSADYIFVDSRLFVLERHGEWLEATGSDWFGPEVFPTVYSTLHNAFYPKDSEWLGNETLDGVPVGHYRKQIPEPLEAFDTASDEEIWVDATGVVRRLKVAVHRGDTLLLEFDSKLFDIGANIRIEAPDIAN